VSTFPDNYSLSDGLLYLGHPQEELTTRWPQYCVGKPSRLLD
jgi:hypothetical protein